jgi:Raf kinase inhibitor-like YbhB/YbcL family protein
MPLLLSGFATLFAVSALAQGGAPAQAGPPVLAKDLAPARFGAPQIAVTSSAVVPGGTLDDKYTQNGENMSLPLTWTKGPRGTLSYVVLAEDSGVDRHDPIVHWVVYDIPLNVTSLGAGQPAEVELPNGANQGLNVRNAPGFIGPKPPAGQTHPYHFEVFALNRELNIEPGKATRNEIVAAMKNHVLATGELIASYTGK